MLDMRFMEKVGEILKRRDLTQAELARSLGVDSARMSRWIQGTGDPDPYQALRIARYLNVSMEYLADPEQLGPPEDASWLPDVEKFVKKLGADELYMRLYGVQSLTGIPRVNAGDMAELDVTRPASTSPRKPGRSGSGGN